jgi:excinuclease ABC subunit C
MDGNESENTMPDRHNTRSRPPTRPGVYLLKDRNGKVMYVGKARNLRNRLRAYTGGAESSDPKVQLLRSKLAGFDYIVAGTETEALVLESNLIKEHRPRYNVKLKDDKRYPFIKVTLADGYARAFVTRVVRQDGSAYFGPYTDAKAMRRTLRLIRQVFPIRQCTTFKRRSRPCLNYQIGRCLGPCIGAVSKEEYGRIVKELTLFLEGRAGDVVALLTEQMERAVDGLRFEEAAFLRDRITDIEKIGRRQRVLTAQLVDRDVVAIARHEGYAVASVVRVRGGKLIACENCPLDLGPRTNDDEVMETFLKQFYSLSRGSLPSEILLNSNPPDREAIEKWLGEGAPRRVRISAPSRGEKRLLVDFARDNAHQALKRAFESRRIPDSVVELGEALGMKRQPRLISGIDISSIGGAHAVGTVVTFRDGRPDRALYRRYRIRTVKGSDDYAMIREVVSRHLKRMVKEERELPDLLLIDGGKGQLSAAATALRGTGARGVTLVGLAKREEEVFVRGRATPLPLPPDSRAKRLLVRVRNEVHRFSITYHRSLREREARRSLLDGVPGVGPSRKEALLRKFGSVRSIMERPPEEIAEVPGIGIATARRIKEALQQAGSSDGPAA